MGNGYTHNVNIYFKSNNNIIRLVHESEEKAFETIKFLNQDDSTFSQQEDNGNIVVFIKTNDIAAVTYQKSI